MISWKHYNPVEIIFGQGCRASLINDISNKKLLVVTSLRGKKQISDDKILQKMINNNFIIDSVTSNPEIISIQNEINKLGDEEFDAIVGFGGGSAIDFAKAINLFLRLKNLNIDLASIIKSPKKEYLVKKSIPFYAIPTTAGTGSEVTQFATVWDHINKQKLSLNYNLFPSIAIIDPELTFNVPYETTISTGLDALNQAFESIWNKNKTPFSSYLASKSIGLSIKSLNLLNEDLNNKEARIMMSEASLLAGMAISQTFTAICHSISYPLTAHYKIQHGFACAFTMKSVAKMVLNLKPNSFSEVVEFNNINSAKELIDELENLINSLKVKETNKKQLKDKNSLFALANEMINPERSDNFILPVNKKLVIEILEDSYY
ncbi:MAG: phosphonoacetaldehyde reductase [Prochlorococcus marinus XMU1428]|nr:phosphonoacetaldehyde reductase [Prochlorococcus marinus XMU1428]